MARAGGKAISSGRISVRPPSTKKRAATRRISTTSADSGYSLCSTDSEDQVLVINKGLDRCAALLQDILQSEARDNTTKPHKATFPKAHLRSSGKVKKIAAKKPPTASHVTKEKVIVRKSAPSRGFHTLGPGPPADAPPPARPPTSCDHVQTQMQLVNPATCKAAPAPAPQSAVLFNCRLPTSTPSASPPPPARPQGADYEVSPQSLPQGGAIHFPSAVTCQCVAPASRNVQQTYAAPASYPPPRQAAMLAEPGTSLQDSHLLQYVAAQLTQLRNHGVTCAPQPASETSSDEEEVTAGDKGAARDISCQTSFSSQETSSPQNTARKIRTVKYLLGEIKALLADRDDGAALRLVTELEHNVSLLPAVVGGTNVHAEIALALQPLRSDNAQLRRRLRILNQQLRDRERAARSDQHSCEVTSLQSMNEALQQQVTEAHKGMESQQNKNQELVKEVEALKEEKESLAQIIRDKEQQILQLQQHNDLTSSSLKTKADDALLNTRSLQFKLDSAEKESRILGISLRQRDAEVARLRDLTRTLQASMAKLLCDLGKQNGGGHGGHLTQATLHTYDQQLRPDQCPASTSIISYLKRLEMDQVIPCSGDQPDQGLTSDPSNKGHYPGRAAPPHSPQKLRPEVNGDFCSLIGDEYKPDETTYLPMASSPRKASFVPPSRLMCTPPEVCQGGRDAGNTNAFSASQSHMSLLNQSEKPTKIQHSEVPKAEEPPGGRHHPPLLHPQPPPPPLFHPLRVGDRLPNHQSALDAMSATSDWSIASFSTFTSRDEQDFRNGLAALDANIAQLQRTLHNGNNK